MQHNHNDAMMMYCKDKIHIEPPELAELIEESSTLCDPPEAVNLDEEPPPPKRKGRISVLLGELFSSPFDESRNAQEKSGIERGSAVLSEEKLELDKGPLEWWKQRRMTFLFLSQLIRKLYCITATSCPSERLFSAAGNLLNNK